MVIIIIINHKNDSHSFLRENLALRLFLGTTVRGHAAHIIITIVLSPSLSLSLPFLSPLFTVYSRHICDVVVCNGGERHLNLQCSPSTTELMTDTRCMTPSHLGMFCGANVAGDLPPVRSMMYLFVRARRKAGV
ncbi:hypothetical protein TraAM80_05761 [Trypanosoma rangeli]|uniref:Uncharacterized protein n=1 Tax=Trypanosoma rangeli TaxID=5698 RepID=A0A422ND40_TRYRA|nr:uncharacterized protein TraAM80_05761 [Trypanosoma rangeli]RNF03398.1 hypothetical protein TraAM80_05761 [Trypanosoma rangeli]|eukprot:RNF03398.1 hypothetical protein TraAM80_05761 [Trypanosoma rangeli]